MKPRNFPGRKAKRKAAVLLRKIHGCSGFSCQYPIPGYFLAGIHAYEDARKIRTKKRRASKC